MIYSTEKVKIHQGHCLDVVRAMPSASVDCIVTSPPYWNLRNYKSAPQVWGPKNKCDHQWVESSTYVAGGAGLGSHRFHVAGPENADRVRKTRHKKSSTCSLCGAWLGELGQEPTPAQYQAHLMLLFDELHRVLKPKGVCWLNIGDGTCGSSKFRGKSLNLVPQRVAIALADSGWCIRSEVVWSKPNPVPEVVGDRPTGAWEPIYMLTKSQKYYFDKDVLAVLNEVLNGKTRHAHNVWTIPTCYVEGHIAPFPRALALRCILSSCPLDGIVLDPFAGSGTVLSVAQEHGRKAIGIELNRSAFDLCVNSVRQLPLPLLGVK